MFGPRYVEKEIRLLRMIMSKDMHLSSWLQSVNLPKPTFEDNTADADRLRHVLCSRYNISEVEIGLELLQSLSASLRENDFQISFSCFAKKNGLVLTGLPKKVKKRDCLGLAIDLGTSRYVLNLIDLSDGTVIAHSVQDNPQSEIGPDILTRIHYTQQKENGSQYLKDLFIQDANKKIKGLCREFGLNSEDICNMVVSGNTTMTHFVLGLNTRWMIREPYIPCVNEPDLIKAKELGLNVGPQARVYFFPNIGSYFGGDLFSGILYSGMHNSEDLSLLVDVGTNAEVVLGNKDWLIACAGAAGPALEGGVSQIGKQAGPGIIDQVEIDPVTLDFKMSTIGDSSPTGICGSGMIDLAAQLFLSGLLDYRGKFLPEKRKDLFQEKDGIIYLTLVNARESGTGQDMLIGQPEIDSLIRSKAAMFTILETVFITVGLKFEDLSSFYVAGTFGNFIKPESAISIGMLPDLPLDKFKPIGNSSIGGASLILQQPDRFKEIGEIKRKMTYLEMNVNQEFMNRFSAAKFLPHTDKFRFPSISK